MNAPIYVMVMPTGSQLTPEHPVKGGPIVMETEVDGATLQQANQRAATLERRYGPCRVARLVFDDHPAFYERRDICAEGDCTYYGQKRPSTCACSKVQA